MAFSVTDRFEELRGKQTQFTTLWNEIGQRTFPRKPNASFQSFLDFTDLIAGDNYDSTLRRGLIDHATGTASLMFPVGEKGFNFKAPRGIASTGEKTPGMLKKIWRRARKMSDKGPAQTFYEECREELNYQLRSNSNFRPIFDEACLERVAFGTSGLYSEWKADKDRLHFRSLPVNTYCLDVDSCGDVNGFYYCVAYTPEQAAQEWGKDKLPDEVKDALTNDDKKAEKSDYIVGVKEVMAWDEDAKKEAGGKKFLLKVEHRNKKTPVHTEGYHELPASFSRYLSVTGSPYGFSPVFLILPEVRRLYRQNELADKIGLATLAPPITALSTLKGRIKRGPLGITYVDDMADAPQVMTNATGDFKIGLERMESARNDIEKALHLDFFKMFANLDDPKITATVARLMEAERATGLGSPYERLTSDQVGPQVLRGFSLLYRNGKLPKPPDEVFVRDEDDNVITNELTDQEEILLPEVGYENRLITALKASENLAYAEWFEMIGSKIFEIAPEEIANLDTHHITRRTFANTVGDPKGLRPEHEVRETKNKMAERAEQAEETAGALEAIKAA